MNKYIAIFKNHELREKLLKILSYIFTPENAAIKLKRHAGLVNTLHFFRDNDFIRLRTYVLYILPYLSKSFSINQKQQLLIHHYHFLQEAFTMAQLSLLFKDGLTCYEERDGRNLYTISLKAVKGHLEFEGSMNLIFECDGSPLYTLGFSFTPGSLFGLHDENIIFIAAIQGTKNEQQAIRKATKFFKDNALPILLIKALEGIAANFGINTCIGVVAADQLSSDKMLNPEKCYAAYDDFWLRVGGRQHWAGFVIDFPLTCKPIELISQPYRNRTIKKRNKSAAIYTAVDNNWRSFSKAS